MGMYLVEALEAGFVTTRGDERVHAVTRTLEGRVALCGGGPIAAGRPGRFGVEQDDAQVCLACFAAALPTPRE
jgi:hypothetical protein